MAIATLAQYYAAAKQLATMNKSALGPASAYPIWLSTATAGGSPGVMAAPGDTTNGVVPTNATTGAAPINAFSGTGYLSGVAYSSSTATWIVLYDRLFHAGAFSGSVGVNSLTSQPSYSSRVPGGTDYRGLQIWLEQASGAGGAAANNTMRVKYTNQDGTTGQVTPTVRKANNVAGALIPVPLASGDSGVQKIEEFEVVTSLLNCTYNVVVARPLWRGRVAFDEVGSFHWMDRTGLPQVWADSCLCLMTMFDATSPSVWVEAEIASA